MNNHMVSCILNHASVSKSRNSQITRSPGDHDLSLSRGVPPQQVDAGPRWRPAPRAGFLTRALRQFSQVFMAGESECMRAATRTSQWQCAVAHAVATQWPCCHRRRARIGADACSVAVCGGPAGDHAGGTRWPVVARRVALSCPNGNDQIKMAENSGIRSFLIRR